MRVPGPAFGVLCASIVAFAASAAGIPAASAQELTNAESGPSADYRIGPGDTLEIAVWRQPELSATLPVRPDGKISIQLVDDMQAVGKTPTQLQNDIEAVLAQYIRTPEVSVLVTGFVGVVGSQIQVLGEVAKPGPVPYRDGVTLLDAVFQAGGLTEFASGKRARLVRTNDGQTEERDVRLDRLLDGDMRQNVVMQPGDVIVVPHARF